MSIWPHGNLSPPNTQYRDFTYASKKNESPTLAYPTHHINDHLILWQVATDNGISVLPGWSLISSVRCFNGNTGCSVLSYQKVQSLQTGTIKFNDSTFVLMVSYESIRPYSVMSYRLNDGQALQTIATLTPGSFNVVFTVSVYKTTLSTVNITPYLDKTNTNQGLSKTYPFFGSLAAVPASLTRTTATTDVQQTTVLGLV